MNSKLKITINIPVFSVIMLCVFVMICRYKFGNHIGFFVFPFELIMATFLYLRQSVPLRMKKGYNLNLINPMYVYIAFMVYRIVISVLTTGSFFEGTKLILYYEMGVLLILNMVVNRVGFEGIVIPLRNFGVLNAFLGVCETVTRSSIFLRLINAEYRVAYENLLGTNDYRALTIFIHPVICAVFCTYVWCILLFYPIKVKWLDIVSKMACVICILGTQSRSSWISFAVINVIYLFQKSLGIKKHIDYKKIKYGLALAILLFVILDIFGKEVLMEGQRYINRWLLALDSNDSSNYNRINMIRIGMQDYSSWGVVNKFFGKGYSYAYNLLQRNSIRGWTKAVDNSYLTVLLDYGIFGLLFMLYFVYVAIRNSLKNEDGLRMCGLGILSLFISAFFYEMFSWFTPNFLFALSISLFFNQYNFRNDCIWNSMELGEKNL